MILKCFILERVQGQDMKGDPMNIKKCANVDSLIMHVKRFLCQLWNNFYKYLVAFEDVHIHIHYTYTKSGKSCLDKVNCL